MEAQPTRDTKAFSRDHPLARARLTHMQLAKMMGVARDCIRYLDRETTRLFRQAQLDSIPHVVLFLLPSPPLFVLLSRKLAVPELLR